jgi:hypothetical protein
MQISTIGLDAINNVSQVHGPDAAEKVVARKPLKHNQVAPYFKALPSCLAGTDACPSAHHWARELMKLGHEARLIPLTTCDSYHASRYTWRFHTGCLPRDWSGLNVCVSACAQSCRAAI